MTAISMDQASRPRGTGWLAFAGTVMIMSGLFKFFDALWAFRYDDEESQQVRTVMFERDLTAWGWVWLVTGILLMLAGLAVVTGVQWARWVGIVMATLSAVVAFQWIYFQPLWAVVSIGLSLITIYGLAAYGGFRDRLT
jgi:hypothetical protein